MQRVRKQLGIDEEGIYSGKWITAAVLDTGIGLHPDFGNRILAFQDFVNHRIGIYDDAGHGTHVAGCLAGSGFLSGGKYRGIAPNCNLVIGKVLDQNGGGNVNIMINALKWILCHQKKWNIRIVNISVSFEDWVKPEKIHSLLAILDEVHRSGILVVVAAGNKGPKEGSISPLGMGKEVFTVGCHDGNYRPNGIKLCADYSGRGSDHAGIRKPDIVAPGTGIMSTSAKCIRRKNNYIHAYTMKSGTSFAAPLVSGTAALLWEKYPFYEPEEIKRKICYGARNLGEPWNRQGWGMLDIQGLL